MNRYRSVPGLGPPKSSPSTTCQKCLKKGHYSYECKASLQERPYISRPSRTQQFRDPKLAPKLTNEKPSELLSNKGVADQILAEAEKKRNLESNEQPSIDHPGSSPHRGRSKSPSEGSVSTISTDRSRSPPPASNSQQRRSSSKTGSASRSPPPERGRKRRFDSRSGSSYSKSPPPAPSSHRKNRRHRTISPDDRGRPDNYRRGSHRSRSGSRSLDKSKIARNRKSLDPEDASHDYHSRHANVHHRPVRATDGRHPDTSRRTDPQKSSNDRRPPRKERSLSPYSRRLALTQAMNMNR